MSSEGERDRSVPIADDDEVAREATTAILEAMGPTRKDEPDRSTSCARGRIRSAARW